MTKLTTGLVIWASLTLPASANDRTRQLIDVPPATARVLRHLPLKTLIPLVRMQHGQQREQILCLALAIYHEARGLDYKERIAVAQVVYNRAQPLAISACAVIWADHGTQFQWAKHDVIPREIEAWRDVQKLAVAFVQQRPADITHGALFFYNPKLVSPDWARTMRVTLRLHHTFMRPN